MENNISNNTKKLVFMDEFHMLDENESLKEKIRDVEGVPNATYSVKDGKVFVFQKLFKMVENELKVGSSIKVHELTSQLFPEALMTAFEAVKDWNIVPVPYEAYESSPGVYKIRHSIFKATLPAEFKSKSEVDEIFAEILLGKKVLGSGDFNYRGQEMILDTNYSTSSLPPLPELKLEDIDNYEIYANSVLYSFNYLDNIEFIEGFTPVSKKLFEELKQLESSWSKSNSIVLQHVSNKIADVWKLVGQLDLQSLNNTQSEVPENEAENSTKLVTLYPELSMLNASTLYWLFDGYQEDRYINSWEAYREDDFIFYFLSALTKTNSDLGHWAAYSLLKGDSRDHIIEFSRAAMQYTKSIGELAYQTSNVMHYLAEDKNNEEQHGPEIMTVMDTVRIGRKFGSAALKVITQFR
ncbi:TPA: hypothetical protein MW242_002937 [Acinetobacter baumannii]|nr:hypothetical protein [Acinetobacter baumannii]